MATRPSRPRDSRNGDHSTSISTSRNKENVRSVPSPSPSPSPLLANRHGRSFIPSLVKSPDKQAEFFTDSFLGNASQTSLIPSPLPSGAAISKPRRNPRQHQNLKHRHTQSEYPAKPSADSEKPRSKPLARGTSPIRSTGLSTPPHSRQGSFVASPIHVLSSPPPALTETYTRIDQEEDLAATEGEISDPESEQFDKENIPVFSAFRPSNKPSAESLRRLPRSRATTPTRDNPLGYNRMRSRDDLTAQSVFSDPTGMSFVDQLTDANLRKTLTPHFQQNAEDRAALDRVWRSKKPIAFSKAGKVLLEPDDVAESVSTSPHVQPDRVIAFSKAGRIRLASDHLLNARHQRTFSDVTQQLDRSPEHQNRSPRDNWHDDDIRREAMPHNPRLHRQPYFPRNHGFPQRSLNTEHTHPEGNSHVVRKSRSESPFLPRSSQKQALDLGPELPERHSPKVPALGLGEMGDVTTGSRQLSDASSDVWAQEAADMPVQSIETDFLPRVQSRASSMTDLRPSPEKSRRLDFDFTGQSFQVSDSPPVRAKNTSQAGLRDRSEREIQRIAKQAVTTNRLSQLRARESVERLRQASTSPRPEGDDLDGDEGVGFSNKIYRTMSNGSNGRSTSMVIARPSPGRSTSHDILSRLARSTSSTRSATPSAQSERTVNGAVVGEDSHKKPVATDVDRRAVPATEISAAPVVRATPKVTGAWTDTILPDTIRTTKRMTTSQRYTQTPHVNAGGWVDTPATNGQVATLEPLLEVTQEVPEELMNGIVKDSASDKTVLANDGSNRPMANAVRPVESLAKRVIHNVQRNDPDDSLMLGNTTIQSLEGILDQDETEMTNQLAQTDTQMLDRLGTKLGRLQGHIREARHGVNNLEHQFFEGQSQQGSISTNASAQRPTTIPFALLTFTVPIPMLFRKASQGQRLPRPTILGWIVATLTVWYIIESILCELYSHPQYATRYTWPTKPEPDFPFVLPTMLYRWSQMEFFYPWIIRPMQTLLIGLYRVVNIWFGRTDGYIDANVPTGVPPISVEQDMGFDMMNDEVL